jgi:hypothetical protein
LRGAANWMHTALCGENPTPRKLLPDNGGALADRLGQMTAVPATQNARRRKTF